MAEQTIQQDVLLMLTEPSDRLTNFLAYLDDECPDVAFEVLQEQTALHQIKIRVESQAAGTVVAAALTDFFRCYYPETKVLPPAFTPVDVEGAALFGPDG